MELFTNLSFQKNVLNLLHLLALVSIQTLKFMKSLQSFFDNCSVKLINKSK